MPRRISQYEAVNTAHRARWQILEFYKSPDRKIAAQRLNDFIERAEQPLIRDRMKDAVTYVTNGRSPILNYFNHIETRPDGSNWAPTTSTAERRNGILQDLWRNSRGHGHEESFWLKAMFHSYRLDAHILECGACGRMEGPLPEMDAVAIARLLGPVILPQDQRCSDCTATQSPPLLDGGGGEGCQSATC